MDPTCSSSSRSSSSSCVVFVVGIYNGLVTKRNRIDEALAQIEVQLKRRHDLIPNLVKAVKGYMGFEQKRPDRGHRGARQRRRRRRPGPRRAGRGRERADRRPALAVRGRRELPRPQGEPERPAAPGAADDDGEPDQLLAPALQRHGARLQQRDPDDPGRPLRGAARLHEARVLRRRARGRGRPERRPQPELTGPRPGRRHAAPTRGRWPRSTTRSARTSATRSCSRWSSSLLLGLLGLRHRLGRHRRPAAAMPVDGASRIAVGRHRRRWSRTSAGDALVLATSGAKEVDETDDAAAPQRRARDGDRGQRADAAGLPHRRHGAQRVRHGPRPGARVGRDHDGPAPEARPRGAPGRHRPTSCRHVRNFDIRFSLMVGVLVGVDRPPGRLLPALHVLGRRAAVAASRDGGGGGIQAVMFVVAIVLAILAPIIGAARAAGRQPPARVPRGRLGVELTRNPVGLERALAKITLDTGGPGGRQPRRPSTSTSRTRSSSSRRDSSACSRPIRRRSSGSTGCAS